MDADAGLTGAIDRIEAALEELRHAAYGFYGARLRAAIHEAADWRLSAAHYRVLRVVEAGRLQRPTVTELAGALLADPARASRIVTDLHRAGLVERVIGTYDRRRREVALTDAGRVVLDEFRRLRSEFVQGALRDWNADDAGRLAESLEGFNASIRQFAPYWLSERDAWGAVTVGAERPDAC